MYVSDLHCTCSEKSIINWTTCLTGILEAIMHYISITLDCKIIETVLIHVCFNSPHKQGEQNLIHSSVKPNLLLGVQRSFKALGSIFFPIGFSLPIDFATIANIYAACPPPRNHMSICPPFLAKLLKETLGWV